VDELTEAQAQARAEALAPAKEGLKGLLLSELLRLGDEDLAAAVTECHATNGEIRFDVRLRKSSTLVACLATRRGVSQRIFGFEAIDAEADDEQTFPIVTQRAEA